MPIYSSYGALSSRGPRLLMPKTIDIVLIGGGGGGGLAIGDGGQTGQVLEFFKLDAPPVGASAVVIGAGGPRHTTTNGGNSTFLGKTANGGAYGANTAGPTYRPLLHGVAAFNESGTTTVYGGDGGKGADDSGAAISYPGFDMGGDGGVYASDTRAEDGQGPGGGGGGGMRSSGGPNSPFPGGGNGYQGMLLVRYLTGKITATGGTITTNGGYTYHKFDTAGSFNFTRLT